MKAFLLLALLALAASKPTTAEEDLDKMLETAVEMLDTGNVGGDQSSALRLFEAVLERDPGNPRSMWHLAFAQYFKPALRYYRLHDRSPYLVAAGPTIDSIIENAKQRDMTHFAHYVLGRYLSFYKAYDQSLNEIDAAIELNPESLRYPFIKADILADKGVDENRDSEVLEAIEIFEMVQQKNSPGSDLSFSDADLFYRMAHTNNRISKPNHEKTIEYYLASIESYEGDEVLLARGWTNISAVYRKHGQCAAARDSAEKALEIRKFGLARSNLKYAVFCLELGSLSQQASLEKD